MMRLCDIDDGDIIIFKDELSIDKNIKKKNFQL